jgi:hypothetical protein
LYAAAYAFYPQSKQTLPLARCEAGCLPIRGPVADGVNFSAVRTQIHFFCVLQSLLSVDLLGEAISGVGFWMSSDYL